MDTNENQDIAGKKYWDTTERNLQVVMQPFSPDGNRIGDFGKRIWHKAFDTALAELAGTGKKLLELGCGGSAYLPYFFRHFGLQVYGMDYSELGCELASRMCEVNGVPSQIICADFLKPPPEMLGDFDVVVSFGVVEHFTDTQGTLSKFANFLRPGGLMITTVPNMGGLVGLAQSVLAHDVFEKHVILKRDFFRKAHEDAGLSIVQCEYLLFSGLGIVDIGVNAPLPKKLALAALKKLNGLVWALESIIGPLPPNALSSPYLICVATKPVNAEHQGRADDSKGRVGSKDVVNDSTVDACILPN